MTVVDDSQADTRFPYDPPVNARRSTELQLVALACALGAADVGGPLSRAEAECVQAARSVRVDPLDSQSASEALRHGEDPLGAAFYRLRAPSARRKAGAIYTPSDLVDPMVRWTLDQKPGRVIDAGSGSGRFSTAIARLSSDIEIVAIDLDPLATIMTRAALAVLGHDKSLVLQTDYTKARLSGATTRTAYLGNPPYLRHHDLPPKTKAWAQMAAKLIGRSISGLAGLHALFYLATAHHAADGDIGCFVTSAEWLDVNYGSIVRELLLHNLGGEALYIIEPESHPFGETATTAAIASFRIGTKPPRVRVRGVRNVAELP
ncbi:MAG: methyltransferase, partial [Candidatus Limnocylindria bacterium]